MKKYMIGNTHFDPVWLWTYDEAMSSIRATFRSALDRMKEDKNFIYSFSTPPVFEWIKNTDKEMFEEIVSRVKEGRWDLCEGWWVQPDCYVCSGESYVRQGLYGQKYLEDNFGVLSDCAFNVDSFGHSPQLPQILKKCGIDYYAFVRPEKKYLKLKKECFNWKGIDGTKIKTYRTDDIYSKDLQNTLKNAEKSQDDVMLLFGVTDHGGAPTKKDIDIINKDKTALFSTVKNFFLSQKVNYVYKGEMITGDYGVFTDNPDIKRKNKILETALLNAEKCLVLAEKENPVIDDCYKDLLFNQFHDIIGGSCIKEAYFDADATFGRSYQTAKEITHYTAQSICKNIKTVGENPKDIWNVIAFNFNCEKFNGFVQAEVQWAHEFDWYNKGIVLQDESGKIYPCQVIQAKAVITKFRSRFITKIDVPCLGYKTFKVVKTEKDVVKLACSYPVIDNGKYKIYFDTEKGGIKKITANGKTVCNELLNVSVYRDIGDTWAFNDCGFVNKCKKPKFIKAEVLESGELVTLLKEEYKFNESKISVYYTVYNNEDYIDVKYKVNSNEKAVCFKLDTKINNYSHNVAVPYGQVKRGKSVRELPLGEWITVDNVTYSCDSAFSYNLNKKTFGISLLRNAIYGDLRLEDGLVEYDHDILSQGVTEGTVRVNFSGNCYKNVNGFINKPLLVIESNHNGNLPSENGILNTDNDDVEITVVKNGLNFKGIVLRAVEKSGKKQNALIKLKDVSFNASFKPFEIKTFGISNGKVKELNMLEK